MTDTKFHTPHDAAFEALGARAPSQQWSSFDVLRPEARKGKANLFVTTLWNFHSKNDARGRRVPTELAICRDERDGSFWSQVPKPNLDARKTHVAHWNGVELAVKEAIPMLGVLKDVRTGRCALENVFDIPEVRYHVDGSSLWLRLVPRGDVGCEVKIIDIMQCLGYPLRHPSAQAV
ncbi:hypothetical protein KY495_12860 [Massilia sp. PAMC28688]|uniref:hypothetical protein n=1 Tax=Massilia sp. PAMC28688 TaxID=2861283 RepID=UPI001C62EEA9|nr:hypothetical protein [Massilia sp. PAMC28688]QYF91694.1 hypothetical protein KY495_12860 [Massilia sp. PAMC28688]